MPKAKGPAKKSLPKLPLVTLYLFSFTLFIYYLSVSFFPFISPNYDLLYTFGLHFDAPWSLLTYMFVHLWPSHLLVDCALLLIFGTIVERKVGGWKTIIIFLSSGFAGGLINLFFFPTKTLIGSSGAVFGLIGAAIVLYPFFSFFLFVISMNLVAPAIVRAVDSAESAYVEALATEKVALISASSTLLDKASSLSLRKEELNRTISAGNSEIANFEETLRMLEADKLAGKVTAEQYRLQSLPLMERLAALRANLTAESQKLTLVSHDILETNQQAWQISVERNRVDTRVGQMSASERTKEGTSQADWPHAAGIVLGGLLLFVLRAETFPEWEGRYGIVKAFLFRKR
jgi:hypothetical protein